MIGWPKYSLRLGNKEFPPAGQRSLDSLDAAGFSRWMWDGTKDTKLITSPFVKVKNDNVWIFKDPSPPWGVYDGIGEYIGSGSVGSLNSRQVYACCLLDYTAVHCDNTQPACDIWPILRAVGFGGFNLVTLRLGNIMIRDEETAPWYELLAFTDQVDVMRNKIHLVLFKYSDNVKAVALSAYDTPTDSIVTVVYPMWGGAFPGAGNLIPVFGVDPREGYDNNYIIIHDFKVSDQPIPYGDRPIIV